MSANNHNCLNCGTTLTGKYCNNCGQKADTHRISIKHFVTHDLLHGVLHIEKGLFYTILQLFKKRGRSALEYIDGQRIRYYNVFYLSLILLGLNILVVALKHKLHPETAISSSGQIGDVFSFVTQYIKYLILTFIPLMAINTQLIFRKKKHNYAEHLIAAGFCMAALLTLSLVTNIINIFTNYDYEIFDYISFFMGVFVFFTPLFFYYGYAKPHYKFWVYSWRIVVFYLLLIVQFWLLLFLLSYLITGRTEFEGKLEF
jgi:hypothetical protein